MGNRWKGAPFSSLLWLLLAESAAVRPEEELCRAWVHGMEPRIMRIPCPSGLNGADDTFCCGSCSAPSCCSVAEARLKQQRCRSEDALRLVGTEGGAQPQPRNIQISNASWFFIAVVIVWFLGFCVCMVRPKYRRWLLGQEEPMEPVDLSEMDSQSLDVLIDAGPAGDRSEESLGFHPSSNTSPALWFHCPNARNLEDETSVSSSGPPEETSVLGPAREAVVAAREQA